MGLNDTAVDQSVETTRKRFEGGQGFVAVEGSDIVGAVVVQPSKATSPCEYFRHPHVASIHQFAVEPSRQGESIGTRLLDTCEAWALANGFRETALDTAEQATHLIAQYVKRGYLPCGHVQWDGKLNRSIVMATQIEA